MRLRDLGEQSLWSRLKSDGLYLSTAPFVFKLKSPLPLVCKALPIIYADYEVLDHHALVDFELSLVPVKGPRRWLKPLVTLEIDGGNPFDPLPAAQALPLLEWGMNWCVTSSAHHFVMCHSAVLARNNQAVVLPAPPGSGKSTLCATLAQSGWRLLSDELALIDPATMLLQPFVRPVSLKNSSIALIQDRFPDATFSAVVRETIKGAVAHMRPPTESVLSGAERAHPRWLVFPRYEPGVDLSLTPLPKAEAMTELAANSFNFSALGLKGFSTIADLVDKMDCYRLCYSSLDQAVEAFAKLTVSKV